jgi:hypothetical protein
MLLVSMLHSVDDKTIDECVAVDEMRIGKGNRSARRKPAPVLLCPPQTQHDLIWDQTQDAAIGSGRLAAWAAARLVKGKGKAAPVLI